MARTMVHSMRGLTRLVSVVGISRASVYKTLDAPETKQKVLSAK
jgi:DNA-binding phage protein